MSRKLRVLVVSRSPEALRQLAESVSAARELIVSTRLLNNGHTDPLSGVQPEPDVLVLRFDAESLAELATLAEGNADLRPPLVVVGPAGSPEAMRLAVRSGARDFLAEPFDAEDLVAALERLRTDPRLGQSGTRAEVTVVLGAAGGVGTSFVASSLAHAFATETSAPTMLMDLDVNAAPLASFLDLVPERGLVQALAEVEYLDEHALPGYVTKHKSGLHLMGAPSKATVLRKDLDANRFATLMGVVTTRYRHVVVDGSNVVDELSLAALGMARNVVLVVQQSVVQLRQAARLLRALYAEVGIPDDRILVVVNRHLKRSTVALDDVRRTLARDRLAVIPNQYQTALASIDGGIPVLDLDRSSAVARAVLDLQRELSGAPRAEHASLLKRALPMFSRS